MSPTFAKTQGTKKVRKLKLTIQALPVVPVWVKLLPTVMPSLAPGASVCTAVVTGWSNTVMQNDWFLRMFCGLSYNRSN